MSVYKRGDVWWYKFRFANQVVRESSKSPSKTVAREAEQRRRRELEEAYNNLSDRREQRIQTIKQIAADYLEDYELRHRSTVFAEYAIGHLCRFLGSEMQADISDETVKQYQSSRLKEGAAPKTINEEVGFLLRFLRDRGDAIRLKMRREKTLKLRTSQTIGKAYDPEQKAALLKAANIGSVKTGEKASRKNPGTRSPFIKPALALAFNAGLRDSEIRHLTWGQIDFEKRFLTVGKSKTDAGEGRTIPLNAELFTALTEHSTWYTNRFGTVQPEWYLFPAREGKPEPGKERPYVPSEPIRSLKSSWRNVKEKAGIKGRFHDMRHTLITELAENGAGDQTIMDIAGHVSRQMLARYSHIRMQAKREALEAVSTQGPQTNLNVEEPATVPGTTNESGPTGAQKWAQ
jgi:integrase